MNKFYASDFMLTENLRVLKSNDVTIEEIYEVIFLVQKNKDFELEFELFKKIIFDVLSKREVFFILQLGSEIDRLAAEKKFKGPIQEVLYDDHSMFGVDELFGLHLAGTEGAIARTIFGGIDVYKKGIVDKMNELGEEDGKCYTFMDDIVGAIASAVITRTLGQE